MALPDYPTLKQEIYQMFLLIMKQGRDERMAPFNQRVICHEGEVQTYSTVDGEIRTVEMKGLSIEDTLTLTELAHMTHQEIVERVLRFGVQFGERMARSFIADLDAELEAQDRVTDAGGRVLDGALLLELFDDIEIDFDQDGRAILPTFITGNPAAGDTIRRLMNEDVEFTGQFGSLLERKKAEWVERESHRKLVD
jgi:hypothetical protein